MSRDQFYKKPKRPKEFNNREGEGITCGCMP